MVKQEFYDYSHKNTKAHLPSTVFSTIQKIETMTWKQYSENVVDVSAV